MCSLCNVPAALGHISQTCPLTHGVRVKRHDDVVRFLAGRLRQRGHRVVVEPHLAYGTTFRKPDLLVVHGNSNRASLLDVKVAADNFPLRRSYEQKEEKYSDPRVLESARVIAEREDVCAAGAVLSWRGCWSERSVAVLKRLGITGRDMQVISAKVLTWTANSFRYWKRSGTS